MSTFDDTRGERARSTPEEEQGLLGESDAATAATARRGRDADTALAQELGRPVPAGAGVSAAYLQQLGRRPILPPTLERELILGAQAGDRVARARLVEAFMPLIGSVARLYRDTPTIERVELIQEGVVGLLRALERYDHERGTPFWAYAAWWVRQAMQQLVSELTRPVVLSDRALRRLARIREVHDRSMQETGAEATRDELVRHTGLSDEQIDDVLAVDRTPRSLEEPVHGDDSQALSSFGELLVDPLAEGEYEQVLDALEAQELLALLAGLSDRERRILRARYGLDDGEGESLRSIGSRLGLSAERVRQLEQRALGKLTAAAGAAAGEAA